MENVRRILEEIIMARMAFLEDLKKGKLDNIHLWSFLVTIISKDSIINVLIQCVVIRN